MLTSRQSPAAPASERAIAPLAEIAVQPGLVHDQAHDGLLQRWYPIPSNGQVCPITELGHAYFHGKLLPEFRGEFVHVRLGELRQKRAVQLYWGASLHDFMLRQSESPAPHGVDVFAAAREAPIPPRWLRPPRNSHRCAFTGLTHGMFYALLKDAGRAIRVSSLTCNQETRAVRLAYLPSLHLYLVDLAARQFAEAKQSAA